MRHEATTEVLGINQDTSFRKIKTPEPKSIIFETGEAREVNEPSKQRDISAVGRPTFSSLVAMSDEEEDKIDIKPSTHKKTIGKRALRVALWTVFGFLHGYFVVGGLSMGLFAAVIVGMTSLAFNYSMWISFDREDE